MYDDLLRSADQAPAMVHPLSMTMMPAGEWRGPDRRRDCDSDRDGAQDWRFQLLDEIDYGIFVLSAQRQLLYANRAARDQIKSLHLLRIEHGELLLASLRDTQALGLAIRAASSLGLRRMVLAGAAPNRLALAVVPVPRCLGAAAPAGNRVLVMLPRRRLCQPLSTYGFARDHGLSAAESQVLYLLCDGLQPTEIAELHGVAISTVRTQIASIRIKTDAATVGELIQRIARLPPICSALQADARGDGASVAGNDSTF